MIPNNISNEAGFKSQFFTIALISSFLIFGTWSLTRLIINLSQSEENQKRLNIFYQKCLDLINYYLDDFKYIEDGIKFIRKNFRHKQVYESVAVEDGLLPPPTVEKKKTIYCSEYYQKVLEKQKANKEIFSEVSVYLTLSSGITLNYTPRYPWYWDGVELFNGIQPNPKPEYNPNYLSPDYVPRIRLFEDNSSRSTPMTTPMSTPTPIPTNGCTTTTTNNNCLIFEVENVKNEEEAIQNNQNDEVKKLSTLLLTKNNSLTPTTNSISVSIPLTFNHYSTNSTVSVPIENSRSMNTKTPKEEECEKSDPLRPPLVPEKTVPKVSEKEVKSISSSPLRKSKSLPEMGREKQQQRKQEQKQKFLKKLKHKKQPKIIYPSIPVNPDLSFVPLYEKKVNESKIESRVSHSDMETLYKKIKIKYNRDHSKE